MAVALMQFGLLAALFFQNCSGTKFTTMSSSSITNNSNPDKSFSFSISSFTRIENDIQAPEIKYGVAWVDSRAALVEASYVNCPKLAAKIDLWLGPGTARVFQNTCFSAASGNGSAYCNFRSTVAPGTDLQNVLIRTWKPKPSCDGYFDSANDHRYSDRILSGGTVSHPDHTYQAFNENRLITIDKSNFSIKVDRNTGAVYELFNKRSSAPSNAIHAHVGAAVQLAFHDVTSPKLTENPCDGQGYWNPTQAGAHCAVGSSSPLSPSPENNGYKIFCDGAINNSCNSANESVKIDSFRLMNFDYGPSAQGPYHATDTVFLAQTIKANDNFIEFDLVSQNRGISRRVTFEAPAVYLTNRYRNWQYQADGESTVTSDRAPIVTSFNRAPYTTGYIQKRIPWITFENKTDASNDAFTIAWFIDYKIEENSSPSFSVIEQQFSSMVKFDNYRIFEFETDKLYRTKYVIFPFRHDDIISSRFGRMTVSQIVSRLGEEFRNSENRPASAPTAVPASTTAPIPASAASPVVTSNVVYIMKSATAGEALANWPASSMIDQNLGTSYSSDVFEGGVNNRGLEVAAWIDGNEHQVSKVILKARMHNGIVQAFPTSYKISITKPDNSGWMEVGTYNTQPDSAGNVQINLGNSYSTYGVLIRPITLGSDSFGNYFFQLAEVQLGN